MGPDSIDARLAAAGLPALPRDVWLEIDEGALTGNVAAVRELIGPDVAINAVVKADAYGHGLIPVARAFERAGADRLCVASLDEALALRGAGLRLPILVLFPIPVGQVLRAAQQAIEIVGGGLETISATLESWRTVARPGAILRVHLEIETGLSRGGVKATDAVRAAQLISAARQVELAGIWTHLATPDDEPTTRGQASAFESAVDALRGEGIATPARHISATGGLFSGWTPVYEAVRLGLSLYGIIPSCYPSRPLAGRPSHDSDPPWRSSAGPCASSASHPARRSAMAGAG